MAAPKVSYSYQAVNRPRTMPTGARAHLEMIASAFKGSSVKQTPCGGCASGAKKNCCGGH